MSDGVVMRMRGIEADLLYELVEQLRELVSTDPATPLDPALWRLDPDAYPDDREASAEFRALTGAELRDTRAADAHRVRTDLAAAVPGEDAEPEDAESVEISLDAVGRLAWMRTLTALRLVVATRLGVTDDTPEPDENGPLATMYDWLGYRLELLMQSLEG